MVTMQTLIQQNQLAYKGLSFVCRFCFSGLANWLYFIFSHDLLQTVLHALYKAYGTFQKLWCLSYFNFEKPPVTSLLGLPTGQDSSSLGSAISQRHLPIAHKIGATASKFSVHLSLLQPLF